MKNLKKVLALVLAFACAFTMFAGAAFTDSADIAAADAVDTLVALGVIDGYEDGSFKPEATVTRAEMAKMIYTILNGGNDDASAYANLPTSFTDLTDDWYKGYIKYLQNSGIIGGKSTTEFAPNDTVTGVEAAKMMLVAAGYSADKAGLEGSAWAVNTMKYANANSLFADVECDVNAALPRQYAAQLLCNSLDMENVVYSKDIEDFKPATDVSEDRTIGGKYMDLVTYEGVLSGSGAFGENAGTDKIGMTTVQKVNGAKADASKYSDMTWDYAEDVTALVGQYVKVMTGKNDKVYGVTAVDSQNTVVTAALSDIENVSSTKIKIDGTEYKFDSSAEVYGLANDTKIAAVATTTYNSADTITFISNDGNETFDVAYIDQIEAVAKVTYVSSESFTAGGTSYDYDEVIAPSDLAKDDYVVKTTDRYTGDSKFVKADTIKGKITSTKGSSPITDIAIDGTWYEVASTTPKIGTNTLVGYTNDSNALELKSTYTLQVVNGVVYYSKLESSDSTDTALVLGASTAMDTDGNMQVKLLFADGSTKVVPADTDYTGSVLGDNGSNAAKAFVSYEVDDGVYSLTKIDDSNMLGKDDYDSAAVGFDSDSKKVNGIRVADSAVVYVQYKDGDDYKTKALTGKDLNAMGSDFGDNSYYVVDGSTICAALIVADDYLPGASADKLYGYITSDIVENNVDGVAYKSFTVWTTENESIDVKMKASTSVAKEDLISFELAEDNYIEGVNKLDVHTGAIKDFGSDYAIMYENGGSGVWDYTFDDDVKFLYLNTKDVEGVNGGELAKADENTTGGKTDTYYANVKYYVEGGKIVLIAIDTNLNKWDGASDIVNK